MTVALTEPTENLGDLRNDYPPGMVVVPCHDQARYHQFTHDLTMLDVPDETVISFQRGASIVQNLNTALDDLLRQPDKEWAWLIADDHSFDRDIIVRLLRHDADIIVPLVTRRGPPFSLVVFDERVGEDDYG